MFDAPRYLALALLLAACSTTQNDPSHRRDTGDADAGDDTQDADDDDAPYTPPEGPYALASPTAADQAHEDDHLSTPSAFTVEVRVGNVSDLRSVGFGLSWDPAVLTQTSRERQDPWLVSQGGMILPMIDALDGAAGTLDVALAVGGPGAAVSTTSSEAIYSVDFAWLGDPEATTVALSLTGPDRGLVQDGAAATLPGVTALSLSVTP